MSGSVEGLWPSGQVAYVSAADDQLAASIIASNEARVDRGRRGILYTFVVTALLAATGGWKRTQMLRKKRDFMSAPGKTRGL